MKRLNEERRERPCIQSWKYLVGFLLMFAFVTGLAAQEKEKKVTMKCVNEKLTDALKRVEKQSGYKIVFSYNELHSIRVNASIQELAHHNFFENYITALQTSVCDRRALCGSGTVELMV